MGPSRGEQIESLSEARRWIAPLAQACTDAMVLTDLHGRIFFLNAAAEQLLGYRLDGNAGELRAAQLLSHVGAQRLMHELLRADRQNGGACIRQVLEVRDAESRMRHLAVVAGLLRDHNGVVGTFGVLREADSLKRTELHLGQTMHDRQILLAELAGTAAHELNQPLTSIMSAAELLKREVRPESAEFRAAELILHECQRMAEIVRKLGQVQRYETKSYVGQQRILDLDKAAAPVDLGKTVGDP